MLRDLKFAARSLRRTPGFAVITILTLGLGLAGTVTMFAAVNAAFLKPLPYPDEQTLVKVYQSSPRRSDVAVPLPVAAAWVAGSRSFSGLAAYLSGAAVNVSDGRRAIRAQMARVSSQFFGALRVGPVRGRLFDKRELTTGGAPAVIISYGLWQSLFDGRADVLDVPLRIEDLPVPIAGVMPEGFKFPDDTDFWTPLEREGPDAYGGSTAHNFDVVGRLLPSASAVSAERDLLSLSKDMQGRDPDMKKEDLGVTIVPLRTDLLGPQSSVVLIGLGAVSCVLLIACVNVINLLLARTVSTATQTSVRLALGASRIAIVRAVIAEGLVLSAGGALVGSVLGLWGTQLIATITPASVAGAGGLSVDWRVAGFTLLLTTLVGVACGLLPSIRASRLDIRQVLASGNRTLASSPHRAMGALVGVEVALAFVLLFSAGLLARSYSSLGHVESGFRTEGLTLATASLGFLPASPYGKPETRRDFFATLDRAVAATPGVSRVGLAAILPLGFSPNGQFEVRGNAKKFNGLHYRLIGGDYFRVLDIPIRKGRALTRDDNASHPLVAVINESLARVVFPGADPIGQEIRMPGMDGGDDAFSTIVGIAADIHHQGPSRPPVPEAYFSYLQRPWRTYSMTLLIDAAIAPQALIATIRRQVATIDPSVPPSFSTMAERMAAVLEPVRFRATLLGVLAAMALALAAIGIVGVVSYGVAQRRQEIGVRVALGATPGAIVALVLKTGLWPVLGGAAAGALLSAFFGRLLSQFLFSVQTRDAVTLATVAAVLFLTALLANWIPARRAARINPVTALRQ